MAQSCPGFSVLRRRDVLLLPVAALAVALPPLPATAAVPEFLTIIGNLVIPPTATPGAGDAAVVAFVIRAVSRGMDGSPADSIDVLAKALDARAGGDFMQCDQDRQRAALTALDTQSYPAAIPEAKTWHLIKGLILAGYYTSEAGCTKELVYDLAPGRWDNDIPLKPGDRAIANDWFAVSFR
jgi:hypothetical protein